MSHSELAEIETIGGCQSEIQNNILNKYLFYEQGRQGRYLYDFLGIIKLKFFMAVRLFFYFDIDYQVSAVWDFDMIY